jgi:hypothetical protein
MALEPSVEVSQYTISLLPRGSIDHESYAITVDRALTREGQIQWAVRNGSWCLGHDGVWEREPIPGERTPAWCSTHRWLDLADALAEARAAVQHIEVNGIPVGAVLAKGGSG